MSTQSQPLSDRIKFIKKTPTDELVTDHLGVVFKTYQDLFKEVCTGCPTKIAGYIRKIKNLKKHKMEKSKFRLKKGSIIPIPGTSDVYSNENLTDEVALKFIKKNPNRRHLFTTLPENINELLKGKKETVTDTDTHVRVNDNEYTVEEGVAILDQIGVSTSAKTIEGVQKRFDGLKAAELKKLDSLIGLAGTINNEDPEKADFSNPEMPDKEE